MVRSKKYDVSQLNQAQYEPGSHNKVLKNLFHIKSKTQLDRLEANELFQTMNVIVKTFGEDHCFSAEDICQIHKTWLGRIYPWAGQYRQVNISKDGFEFTKAMAILPNMEEFEKAILRQYTPCKNKSIEEIVKALAIVHTELVLIHPFREGNGRLSRLVSILMGWQAQLPTLDFGGLTGFKKREYFAAVRAGMKRDYKPMEKVFESIVKRTVKNAAKK